MTWTAAPALVAALHKSQAENMPIVLATGVFDILHQEHTNFLHQAKKLGGVLVVGLESDQRVKQLKGEGRPIHSQNERVEQLAKLGVADAVFVLPEDFDLPQHRLELLQFIRPAILAVSSHTPHLHEKRQLMAKVGGEVVVVHQHNPEISTTQLLKQSQPTPAVPQTPAETKDTAA